MTEDVFLFSPLPPRIFTISMSATYDHESHDYLPSQAGNNYDQNLNCIE
jgi:hypothetical protein